MLELCSEKEECCTYPKGCYFDYVRFFVKGGKAYLEGKGRYGCVTLIELDAKQEKGWLRRYQAS